MIIAGGPKYTKPTHRVNDISFSQHTVLCACGAKVQVVPDPVDELPISINERLADRYREHRLTYLPAGARSHR